MSQYSPAHAVNLALGRAARSERRDVEVPQAEEVTIGRLMLIEYEKIKDEQKNRIGFRDNLIYATLGSMALVVAAVLQQGGRPDLLLLLPPVTLTLGWTYVSNDEKISAIGRYIREDLTPRLEVLTGASVGIFAWELKHRADARRRSRKYIQFVVDVGIFCIPACAAVVVYWSGGRISVVPLAISIIELVLTLALAVEIARHADFA